MASIAVQTLRTVGCLMAGGLVQEASSPYREVLLAAFSEIAPASLLQIDPDTVRRDAIQAMCALVNSGAPERLILIGHELVILEALAVAEFKGVVHIIPDTDSTEVDRAKIAANIPKGLAAKVEPAGALPWPIDPVSDGVLALAVNAGYGNVLVTSHTARTLKYFHSAEFVGEISAYIPVVSPVFERPRGWQEISAGRLLRELILPDSISKPSLLEEDFDND